MNPLPTTPTRPAPAQAAAEEATRPAHAPGGAPATDQVFPTITDTVTRIARMLCRRPDPAPTTMVADSVGCARGTAAMWLREMAACDLVDRGRDPHRKNQGTWRLTDQGWRHLGTLLDNPNAPERTLSVLRDGHPDPVPVATIATQLGWTVPETSAALRTLANDRLVEMLTSPTVVAWRLAGPWGRGLR